MASITMTASLVGCTSLVPMASRRRSVAVASCARSGEVRCETKEEGNNGRRELMFAAAAAALCSAAGMAVAEEEPKRGSVEAKKKYAQVCVTMPTARICRY